MEPIQLIKGNKGFTKQVELESGEKVNKCYQCGNCSAGCPMTFAYDLPVSKLMRLIQLGQKERVLSSRSIWMCVTCEACSTRCPNNIDVSGVLESCRHMARREGKKGEKRVRAFIDSFMQSVRWHGKSHELGLMAVYKLRSGRLLDDMFLAPSMLLRNKLPIFPHRVSDEGRKEVAAIFKRFKELQKKRLEEDAAMEAQIKAQAKGAK